MGLYTEGQPPFVVSLLGAIACSSCMSGDQAYACLTPRDDAGSAFDQAPPVLNLIRRARRSSRMLRERTAAATRPA